MITFRSTKPALWPLCSLAASVGLLLLQCTGQKAHPAQPKADLAIVDLPASSIKRVQTVALGERTAFSVELCPDPKRLSTPIGHLAPMMRSQEDEPVPRITASYPERCNDLEALDPAQRTECRDFAPSCVNVVGLVNRPGQTTLEFIGPTKNAEHPWAVVARILLDLPQSKTTPNAHDHGNLMKALARFDAYRVPAVFAQYWDAKFPVVFAPDGASSASAEAIKNDPLWSPWFNSSHVLESVGMAVLGGSMDPREAATIPVDAVVAPNMDRTPAPVATTRVLPPAMARWVPKNAAWTHFPEGKKLLQALDELEDLASGAALGVQHDGQDRMLRARYSTALGVDESTLTRLFNKRSVKDVGLVSHDLSLRDGTDLSLVIQVTNTDAHQQLREMFRSASARSNARIFKDTILHREVTRAQSDDGRVHSFLLIEGNWAVISNSRAAVSRLLDAYDGRQASIDADAAYRYLLSTGAATSDGTFYVGEGFWDAQFTAERRVAHRRRLLCAGSLQVLSSAVLAYRRDRGHTPNMTELTSAGYLFEDDLHCPDGGTISVEHGAAQCTVHGHLASLTPAIEHLPKAIKPSERDGYLAYVKRRGQDQDEHDTPLRWEREFAFPVAAQFSLGSKFVAKVRAFPNVQSEELDWLRRWATNSQSVFGSNFSMPNTIGSLSIALDLKPKSSADTDASEASSSGNALFGSNDTYAIHKWLTGRAQVFIGDGAIPFGIPLDRRSTSTDSFLVELRLWAGAFYTLLMAPISGVVELKDPELARQALSAALMARGQRLSEFFDRYDLLPYRDRSVHVLSVPLLQAYLYFAFLDGSLVFSNRKALMLSLVDQFIDRTPHSATTYPAQAAVEVFPQAFNVTFDAAENSWQASLRRVCHKHLAWFDLLAQSFGPKPATDPRLTQAYSGFDAKCPEGGNYRFDPIEGGAYCTLHGRPGHARQPIHLSKRIESRMLFRGAKHIAWTFGVTPHTVETELHIDRE